LILDSRFRAINLGFRVWGLVLILDSRFRAINLGFRVYIRELTSMPANSPIILKPTNPRTRATAGSRYSRFSMSLATTWI
jgi:hypothetical protein